MPGSPDTVTGNADIPVSAVITGLTGNTTYHYRVMAKNFNGGTDYGADMTFVTCVPPTASTLPAGAVESTSATLNGTVNAHDTTTAVAFEYGLDAGYGTRRAGFSRHGDRKCRYPG